MVDLKADDIKCKICCDMKQFIVMTAMLCLGCVMFQFMIGAEDSIYASVRDVWVSEVEIGRNYP